MNREYYGIDAPRVVCTLGLLGIVCVGCRFLPNIVPGASIAHNCWMTGISALAAAGWMLTSSLWIKRRVMRSLLDQRRWRGDEKVLDIGCGRGLLTVEAARRVPNGKVHGVDIWQSADLSGNGPSAIRTNAAIAGVANRIEIDTGDARELPYADASFDVVCSMTAIHNIESAAGRRKAISEVWRVLRPGGQIHIFDIQHTNSYLRDFHTLGVTDTDLAGPIVLWGPFGWRFRALKPLANE